MLPSVDLAQDVGQHEVPLPPPARSGRYATQHDGLLDGADDALREVGVAPGHLLLDALEIHQLLELPLEPSSEYTLAGTPRAWNTFFMPAALLLARRSFSGSAATFLVSASMAHQHEGVWLAPEGLHVGQVHLQFMGSRGTKLL